MRVEVELLVLILVRSRGSLRSGTVGRWGMLALTVTDVERSALAVERVSTALANDTFPEVGDEEEEAEEVVTPPTSKEWS